MYHSDWPRHMVYLIAGYTLGAVPAADQHHYTRGCKIQDPSQLTEFQPTEGLWRHYGLTRPVFVAVTHAVLAC